MRLLASLLYCLLALAGCHENTGTTSITRASVDGADVLFSKTATHDGVARFHCLLSQSRQCHYLVFAERCQAHPGSPAATAACTRQVLERFALAVGQTRELRGLPPRFG
ncbi:hypothetical protein HH299_12100, partial [Xanthomonas sp. Kuri4-2]